MGMHRARRFSCSCIELHNKQLCKVGRKSELWRLNNLLKVTQLICGQAGIRVHVSLTPKAQVLFTTTFASQKHQGLPYLPSNSVFSCVDAF